MDRYIVNPGQALAYMLGRLEIMRMRREAEDALGDRFDIKGFHDTVLGGGMVPMPDPGPDGQGVGGDSLRLRGR